MAKALIGADVWRAALNDPNFAGLMSKPAVQKTIRPFIEALQIGRFYIMVRPELCE